VIVMVSLSEGRIPTVYYTDSNKPSFVQQRQCGDNAITNYTIRITCSRGGEICKNDRTSMLKTRADTKRQHHAEVRERIGD
jgi:hypothetical protein